MEKRSQLTLKGLVELIAIAIIILSFIYVGYARGSGEDYFKLGAAKEITLIVNTLCNVNGNAEIIFPTDLSKYNIEAQDNLIYVYSPMFRKNTDPTAGTFIIAKPNCKLNTFVAKPKTFIIKKENKQITFIDGNA